MNETHKKPTRNSKRKYGKATLSDIKAELTRLEMETFEDNNEETSKKITELKSNLKVVELMLAHY
jgi:hypothetical protein|tara:strand:- start:2046 stop:2240 length:195 start_codon:yes stop_codon:yes gene_type:complete